MILDKNLSIKKLTILTFIIMYSLFFIMTIINLYSYSRYEFSKNDKLIKNFNTTLSQQLYEKFNNLSEVSKYPLIIPEIDKLHSTLTSDEKYDIADYNYLNYLSISITNLRMIFDCNIILGGYVGGYLDNYRIELDNRLNKYNNFEVDVTYVKIGKYKKEAAAIGIGMHFVDKFFNDLNWWLYKTVMLRRKIDLNIIVFILKK